MTGIMKVLLGAAGALIAASIQAQDCTVAIDSTDQMRFDRDRIVVSRDCETVEVTLTHSGRLNVRQMGHNWVLVASNDLDAVVAEGIRAGFDNGYLKPDDTRVLAATELIGGGESTTITFSLDRLDPGGRYEYVCTFPGHSTLMRGEFVLE